ncbi:MAG: UDP-glucose 4-epimerase GalE [Bacteroidetes bacterium]|nr:UDP-glucose 4-epimerase GalE [Bacteroidota bacterium]
MNKKDILVTGGLGFIGSHTAVSLHEAGYRPILLDNLSNSELSVLEGIEKITGVAPVFFKGDVNDPSVLNGIFEQFHILAVIHFAAYKAVGESVEKPLEYYHNNVGGMINLLKVMKKQGVSNMVFSSSCTVYGEPEVIPVTENEPVKDATSPYGASKQMCETILKDVHWCHTQCLRYFNPVGAHESGFIGELPIGIPNNLVPYITQTAAGIREKLTVHGNDYPTADGTCIRDYIHVMDLADAHVAALSRLLESKEESYFETFNLGTGNGSSVMEVVEAFEKATGIKIPTTIGPRRAGDVVRVWADTTKVNRILQWKTKRNLQAMMADAWRWQLGLDKSKIKLGS